MTRVLTFSQIVLYSIIGLNVAVWLLVQGNTQIADTLFTSMIKLNSAIADGEWWRLLTAGFVHVNILHLFMNMYALYVLWLFLKDFYQTNLLFILYIVSIIGGSLLSFFMNPDPSIGASGGVFGLTGAAIAVALKLRSSELLKNLGQVLIINIFIGVVGFQFIDNFAHLGGLLVGFFLGYITIKPLPKLPTQDSFEESYDRY